VKSKRVDKFLGPFIYGQLFKKFQKDILAGKVSIDDHEWDGEKAQYMVDMNASKKEVEDWTHESLSIKVAAKMYKKWLVFEVVDVK